MKDNLSLKIWLWKIFARGTSGSETYFSCETHKKDVVRKVMRSTGAPREKIILTPVEN